MIVLASARRPQYALGMTRRSLGNARWSGAAAATMRSMARGAVALVVCTLALTGCSAASIPPPEPTQAEIRAAMATFVEKQVEIRSSAHPEIWTGVQFRNFIEPDEMARIYEGCVSRYGVTNVTVGADGSMSWAGVDTDEVAMNVVNACTLQYPPIVFQSLVRTEEQLEYFYTYTTSFLVPCLRSNGYGFEAPPSRDEFLESAQRELSVWSPYNTFTIPSKERWSGYRFDSDEFALGRERIENQCPQFPDGMEPEY
jgi:hypothetical protein